MPHPAEPLEAAHGPKLSEEVHKCGSVTAHVAKKLQPLRDPPNLRALWRRWDLRRGGGEFGGQIFGTTTWRELSVSIARTHETVRRKDIARHSERSIRQAWRLISFRVPSFEWISLPTSTQPEMRNARCGLLRTRMNLGQPELV